MFLKISQELCEFSLLFQNSKQNTCATLFFNKVAGVTRIRIYSASHFSRIFLHSDWIRRDTEYLKDKEKEKRKKFWKFLKDAGRKSCEQWKIKLSQEEKVAKVTRFCLQHFLLATISTLKDSLMQIWKSLHMFVFI